MIHKDDTATYFMADKTTWGVRNSTEIDGADYGVALYQELEAKVVLTISRSPFSFHEHLTAATARLLGEALLAAANELDKGSAQ